MSTLNNPRRCFDWHTSADHLSNTPRRWRGLIVGDDVCAATQYPAAQGTDSHGYMNDCFGPCMWQTGTCI